MRKYVLWQEPDIEKLEKKINCGQIEEVIFQVGDHMPFDTWTVENIRTLQLILIPPLADCAQFQIEILDDNLTSNGLLTSALYRRVYIICAHVSTRDEITPQFDIRMTPKPLLYYCYIANDFFFLPFFTCQISQEPNHFCGPTWQWAVSTI